MKTHPLSYLMLLIVSLLISHALDAQTTTLKKEKFHLHEKGENEWGYAQAVKVGNTIYISGTVAGGDTPQALDKIYQNLQKTLAHYNADFSHVVKENLYTVDIDAVKAHHKVRKNYYKEDFPASTWVQIDRLFEKGINIEIDIIAVVPE